MTSISPISFRGSESTGSIAYRNNKPEENGGEGGKINSRNDGSETTGSVAYRNKPEQPTEGDKVNFRGNGSESTGSIGHKDTPVDCPNCGTPINFKGKNNSDKKGVSTVGVIGGLVALTAATIIALGYAHKKGSFKNISDGWMKTAGEKIEPAAAKCHEWCATVKKTGLEWWNKLKSFGSKKD